MADWPRTIKPKRISDLWSPGALRDLGHTGVIQIRATLQVGWAWQEVYPLLSVRDPDHMELTARIKYAWNRGEIFDVTHPLVPGSGISPNGAGGGSPVVNGGSQTGSTINISGASAGVTNWARAGDAFKFVSDDAVYICRESASSDGGGLVALPISPNLRQSPAASSAVTRTGVKFRATLLGRSQFEDSWGPGYYADFSVMMTEALG